MAKFVMPKDASDNAAIVEALGALHACMDRRLTRIERRVETARVHTVKWRAEMIASLGAVEEALGLRNGTKTPVALWSPSKSLIWLTTIGGGLFIFAKLLNAIWPYAVGAVGAIWKTALH